MDLYMSTDAVAALLVVAEGVAAEVEEAGVGNGLLAACACRCSSARQRHEGLEGRAGRIGAVERAVDHRLVGRVVEHVPVLRVDAVDEQVGVVAGHRHQGQDAAGGRLDRHQRAAALAEGLLGDLLQLGVERQRQVVAGHRRGARQRAHGAAAGIDLDLLEAGAAVQLEFVVLLQAGLAEVLGAAVVGPRSSLLDLAPGRGR